LLTADSCLYGAGDGTRTRDPNPATPS
jgi:hypothetical protein